jgi:hypothetical protein
LDKLFRVILRGTNSFKSMMGFGQIRLEPNGLYQRMLSFLDMALSHQGKPKI